MSETHWHTLATVATATCWGLFVFVWLIGAVYNARHAPRVRRRAALTVPWALAAVVVLALVYGIAHTTWRSLSVRSGWLYAPGLALLLVATGFTLWARSALGTMWSGAPTLKEEHELRSGGPYAITRHPIYTGMLGMTAGTAMLAGLGRGLAVLVLATLFFEGKIRVEERLLAETFPGRYEEYRQRVPQLVPGAGFLSRLRRKPGGSVRARVHPVTAPPEIHRVRRLFVCAYLVEEEDGLTLVDTLIPGSSRRILAAANKLGKPIRRIALTHAHGDHIGSLDDLVDALGEVEVIISAREARLLEKDASLDPGEPQERVRGGLPGARTKPTRTVEPGDRIGSLEVVACPGHTPGHVAFFDPRDRTLYCGDALTTIGGVATAARANRRLPVAGLFAWHRPTALASARALRALDPARLATGHGPVVEAPAAALDRAIARAERS